MTIRWDPPVGAGRRVGLTRRRSWDKKGIRPAGPRRGKDLGVKMPGMRKGKDLKV